MSICKALRKFNGLKPCLSFSDVANHTSSKPFTKLKTFSEIFNPSHRAPFNFFFSTVTHT
jgi:hypothetical protein